MLDPSILLVPGIPSGDHEAFNAEEKPNAAGHSLSFSTPSGLLHELRQTADQVLPLMM